MITSEDARSVDPLEDGSEAKVMATNEEDIARMTGNSGWSENMTTMPALHPRGY